MIKQRRCQAPLSYCVVTRVETENKGIALFIATSCSCSVSVTTWRPRELEVAYARPKLKRELEGAVMDQ